MGSIGNIITTTFRARAGQAIAEMGGLTQGFGQLGNQINQNTRLSERFGNQWKAIGTTLRYAIAGSAVFGLASMVRQLKDVQTQLGLIAAIGTQPGGGLGGIAYTSQQITNLGNDLRNASVTAIQPVSDINDAAINFLSTVENVPEDQLSKIVTNLGQTARLAQTPVEDLTKAATTMNIAFGRANNFTNIKEFNRQFFALISSAPGGATAGPQIVQQLGPLASVFQLAPGRNPARSQAQLLSLVLGVLRFGGTPATGIRGLQYLAQQIVQPATPKARQNLNAIGITPQFVQQNGIYAGVLKLLQHIRPQAGAINPRKLANLDEDTLAQFDESGQNLPGIPANLAGWLRDTLGRVHAIRAAATLASQLQQRGGVESLGQDLELMLRAQNDQLTGARNLAGAWERFRKRARLQEATQAVNAMTLQVAQAFEPVLNLAAGGVLKIQGLAKRHPQVARDVARGGAAFLGAIGISRFLTGKSLFGLGGGSAFVAERSAQAAVSGLATLGGSPQNPLYVIVVGQIFGKPVVGGSPLGGTEPPSGGGGGLGGFLRRQAGKVAGAAGAASLFARYGSDVLSAGGKAVGFLGAETPAIPDAYNYLIHGIDPATGKKLRGGNKWLSLLTLDLLGRQQVDGNSADVRKAFNVAYDKFGRSVSDVYNVHRGTFNGRAELYMTIDINQNGKITRKKVHVPVSWEGGRHPRSKAQIGTSRGN